MMELGDSISSLQVIDSGNYIWVPDIWLWLNFITIYLHKIKFQLVRAFFSFNSPKSCMMLMIKTEFKFEG